MLPPFPPQPAPLTMRFTVVVGGVFNASVVGKGGESRVRPKHSLRC